ncbi:HAD-IIB family hydrolase [Propionimicrobium sp. PCR01-08-3]|uniref:HAD-IIB family hydrolase n=1 Tax=Propionimicrobium sp. PCR01-08-3 TaxID=3052086 RepID=UPI00255CE7EB|nr:HAD-IIB family hydrolase [Propionimicrobium sp. PCR01-08-3]WIY83694.1 HAD-IIB family hydrolase [Propionimicrobium sp. PCR01-08-3]
MNPFDLIATDLDGTFLDDAKRIPEMNAHAIQVAAARGIPTVFASGRPLRWFGVLDDLTAGLGWAIAANGAVTFDLASGQVAHVRPMDPEATLRAALLLRERVPDAVFAAEYLTDWGTEPDFASFTREIDADFQAPLEALLARGPIVKLLVVDPRTRTDELAAIATPLMADHLTVTFSYISEVGMLEMSAPGVSKALALRELLADLRLAPERMLAFGDMPNDLQMLDLAGLGYVMETCHPAMLDAGFPIAGDNNSGGVGRTILRLLGEQ